MLVLSRRKLEKLYLEVPPSAVPVLIEITVQDFGGAKVKLGCVAPRLVKVERGEVREDRLNEEAGK